jgi:hypothetical protein
MIINDIQYCTHIGHSEEFFEGAKPFLIHLGSKFMYLPVRPYVLTIFVLFFFINIMSPAITAALILPAL